MKKTALILACSISLAGVAGAENSAPPAAPRAETKATGPRIAVEPESFDFGKALQNKTLTKEFSVRNLGTEDLVISGVASSCGCTVAQLVTPKTLKPGASTPLVVSMDTRTASGPIKKTVTLSSNDPVNKALMVEVSAAVQSNAGTGAPLVPAPK